DSILRLVSEKTGYPVEMIGLEMDLEADLGIDSIKRVEILSALEEKIPDLPIISPEIIGRFKTLKQIASHLSDSEKTDKNCRDIKLSYDDISDSCNNKHNASVRYFSNNESVVRNVVSIIETPADTKRRLSIPNGGTVIITDDRTGLSKAIESELKSFDIEVFHASIDMLKRKKVIPKAFGLIILPDRALIERTRWNRNDEVQLKNAFLVTKRFAPDLIESAGFFATVTHLDGAFGFRGKIVTNPLQGGLAGLAKTVHMEWENVLCRSFDVSPNWKNPQETSKAIVSDLLNADRLGPVEVGLDPSLSSTVRYTLKLKPSPLPPNHAIKTDLDDKDVVIVTGGARGITASTLFSLSSYAKPTLILLGRSPAPTAEPDWLTGLKDESEMKTAILEKEFSDYKGSPRKLEERLKQIMTNREISDTLNRLMDKNIIVRYYSVDIRHITAVRSVLDEIRSVYGPIKGIIHGAGVVEDRLIIDKTAKQFENVFDTKVKGIRGLLQATEQDHLKYLIFFSSIVARIGNRGQADYAMANEVLNKIAWQESLLRPKCRVISINWGPWDGGMVTPDLKREFARKKIGVIPVETGAEFMLREMIKDGENHSEIVAGVLISSDVKTDKNKKETFSLSFKHEIDIDRYPILSSHIIGGKPVVPFALITEWIGHGALHENPGLFLFGIDNMQLFNGIRLEHRKMMIRLLSGKTRKKGSAFEVNIELRDGLKNKMEVIHTSAKAILTEAFPKPPLFDNALKQDAKSYPKAIDEVYETILFHGDKLRGIKKIISCTPRGIVADLTSAPPPKKW
ncbi:MAG: SDR family NAD(P)-dependent oxidoreductase, partial [Desulfobacterales bacterium]